MAGAAAPPQGLTELLSVMPAGAPVNVVFVDVERLDAVVKDVQRRFSPGDVPAGFLDQMKQTIPLAQWADYGEPIGITVFDVQQNSDNALIWLRIPGFAEKMKSWEQATQEEGVWTFPVTNFSQGFARKVGDFVQFTDHRPLFDQVDAASKGKKLADVLRPRMDLFVNRHVLMHVNAEPLRGLITGQLAQASQMAPMILAMSAQQSGQDPAMAVGTVSAMIDAFTRFVEQLDTLDLTLGLTKDDATLTVAAGFKDGPIRQYLQRCQPASEGVLLASLPDRGFVVAGAYHVPGKDAPFMDYFIQQMLSAKPPMMPPPAGGEEKKPASQEVWKKSLESGRRIARLTTGQNFLATVSEGSLCVLSDYLTDSPAEIEKLVGETPETLGGLLSAAGPQFEKLKPQTVHGVTVSSFRLQMPANNPQMAAMARIYGANPVMAVGTIGHRVRAYLGAEEHLSEAFASGGAPLARNARVQEALRKLPRKRNGVLLIDPAGILPMIGPMLGMPVTKTIPPGPPIAVSLSLSGEPARLDVHVPFRAIERIKEAMPSPNEPM
ncbi:MAG: hypothetical protein D6788_11490 [Planctomycetota bacterium]|nr:MAG: hypothetical protein D6788_11490 [Planctomycetota bacterium]